MVKTQVRTLVHSSVIGSMLENYGCHCLPKRATNAGYGQAMDEYDSACRDLARCYKCLIDDYYFLYDRVITPELHYEWHLDVNRDITCSEQPDDDTAREDLCLCEAAYASQLGKIWDDNTFNYTLWGSDLNPSFDFDSEVHCVKNGMTEANVCCGDFPERFPFNVITKVC